MSAIYSIYTSPNHAPIPNHLPTLIVTPYGQPHHTLCVPRAPGPPLLHTALPC